MKSGFLYGPTGSRVYTMLQEGGVGAKFRGIDLLDFGLLLQKHKVSGLGFWFQGLRCWGQA